MFLAARHAQHAEHAVHVEHLGGGPGERAVARRVHRDVEEFPFRQFLVIRADIPRADFFSNDVIRAARGAARVDDHLDPFEPRDARRQGPDAAGAGDEHALWLPRHPALNRVDLAQRLLHDRHRLEQHRELLELPRHPHEILRQLGIGLREIAVPPPNADKKPGSTFGPFCLKSPRMRMCVSGTASLCTSTFAFAYGTGALM